MILNHHAVPENVLALLNTLMADQALDPFYLVGGTSLALRLGHRISIDIDLFTHDDIDVDALAEFISKKYSAQHIEKGKDAVLAMVQGVKLDLIAHKHPLVEPLEVGDGIRLVSLKDIAAMKINAISNRGAKKDFWDYAALLKYFSTEEMLCFFEKKYPSANAWHAEKSLAFFDDSELDPDPVDLSGMSWPGVKRMIIQSLGL
jgi:predicted nucleotidyltransferase component of viral defense system